MNKLIFQENLLLGKNESIAICCLWSDKSMIESVLDSDDYYLLGNLYSTQGINILVRNLLREPKIRFLVLTGDDRNKTGFAIQQLFEMGLDGQNKIIGTNIQLDSNITSTAIAFLTLRVKLFNLIGQQGKLKDTLADLKTLPLTNQFSKSQNVPLPMLTEIPYISNDNNGFFTFRIEDCRKVCQGKTCFSCIKPLLGVREIVIEHYSNDRLRTAFFVRGTQFERVWAELKNSSLISNDKHKNYLERELEKCLQTLELNQQYQQSFQDLSKY